MFTALDSLMIDWNLRRQYWLRSWNFEMFCAGHFIGCVCGSLQVVFVLCETRSLCVSF
jgi:hypothetical protein